MFNFFVRYSCIHVTFLGHLSLMHSINLPTDLLDASNRAKRERLSSVPVPESSPMFTSRTLEKTWMMKS